MPMVPEQEPRTISIIAPKQVIDTLQTCHRPTSGDLTLKEVNAVCH